MRGQKKFSSSLDFGIGVLSPPFLVIDKFECSVQSLHKWRSLLPMQENLDILNYSSPAESEDGVTLWFDENFETCQNSYVRHPLSYAVPASDLKQQCAVKEKNEEKYKSHSSHGRILGWRTSIPSQEWWQTKTGRNKSSFSTLEGGN